MNEQEKEYCAVPREGIRLQIPLNDFEEELIIRLNPSMQNRRYVEQTIGNY